MKIKLIPPKSISESAKEKEIEAARKIQEEKEKLSKKKKKEIEMPEKFKKKKERLSKKREKRNRSRSES